MVASSVLRTAVVVNCSLANVVVVAVVLLPTGASGLVTSLVSAHPGTSLAARPVVGWFPKPGDDQPSNHLVTRPCQPAALGGDQLRNQAGNRACLVMSRPRLRNQAGSRYRTAMLYSCTHAVHISSSTRYMGSLLPAAGPRRAADHTRAHAPCTAACTSTEAQRTLAQPTTHPHTLVHSTALPNSTRRHPGCHPTYRAHVTCGA